MEIVVRRLESKDGAIAHKLFALMSAVFGESQQSLNDAYLHRLLASENFWAMAAFSGSELLGGLTAHSLPMTRAESTEVFIYDIAVHAEHQRKGVGISLIAALREQCKKQDIGIVFVPADDDDVHAIDFYKTAGGQPSPVTFFTFSAINST